MVLSKLYVVGSVLIISNLKVPQNAKIAKENGWREVLEGKKASFVSLLFLLSLCIPHISPFSLPMVKGKDA